MEQANIQYRVRQNKRARRLSISVYCDGSCVVTAPISVNESLIEGFVRARSKWIKDKLRGFWPFRPVVRRRNSRARYLQYKEAARELVMRRIPELNKIYGFKIARVSIRNQRSRWGSCSAEGNLNFNYRIALLPAHLADYIIVHELCHIGEMNHGQKFWALVARTLPRYRALRAELRSHSLLSL